MISTRAANDPALSAQDAAVVHLAMISGGQAADAVSGTRYSILNPANGSLVGTAPLGCAEDAEHAIRAASAALDGWHRLSTEARAEVIAPSLDAVEHAEPELAPLLTREQGKPVAEASAEIAGFVSRMRTFMRLACAARSGRVLASPSMRSGAYGRMGEPHASVAAALTAWNFPIGLLAKKLGPVLMAGGTVIVKPAYTTPLATLRLVELMNAAGLPQGVLSCVTGHGDEIGAALVTHAEVGRVHLTGSNVTGQRIAEAAGPVSRELLLELGGSDPMIVCQDADLEKALKAAVVGRYRNAGQICTAVKRLYVDTNIYDEFVRELIALVSLRQPGDGLVPAEPPHVRMGPLHTATQRDCIEEQLEDAVRKGAHVLLGGSKPADPAMQHGHFFKPTLVADVCPGSKLVTEEVFGPVLPIFRTRDLDDAITQVNLSPWDLSASIWIRDHELARNAGPRIRCRRFWVNRLPFGLETVA